MVILQVDKVKWQIKTKAFLNFVDLHITRNFYFKASIYNQYKCYFSTLAISNRVGIQNG